VDATALSRRPQKHLLDRLLEAGMRVAQASCQRSPRTGTSCSPEDRAR
jgi:hypothetical protein